MTGHGLEGHAVGYVLGDYEYTGRYERVGEEYALETTVTPSHDAFLDTADDLLPAVDYLVVERGAATRAVIDRVRDADVSTLYVDHEPGAAQRAMTTGADVFLERRHTDRIGPRLESLHVGATVDNGGDGDQFPAAATIDHGAYVTLMERFDDLVYVFDRHGRFARANEAKARSQGRRPADLVGDSDFDYFAADTALSVYQDCMAVMEGHRTVENETEWIQNGQGDRIHVTVSKHPIENDAGTVIGQIGISRDITALTRQRVLVTRMKEAVEHLYGTYDHNFRNRSQANSGVVARLEEALGLAADLEAELGAVEAALNERDADESRGGPGAGAAAAGSQDLEQLRARCEAALATLEDATERLSAAQTGAAQISEDMTALIDDFSALVAVVKTVDDVEVVDVGGTAAAAFGRPVGDLDLTVTADSYKVPAIFEQLERAIDDTARVTLRETDRGFDVVVPEQVTVPSLTGSFFDQNLGVGTQSVLKVRLLVHTLGWDVETVPGPDGGTVMRFDVNHWKTDDEDS